MWHFLWRVLFYMEELMIRSCWSGGGKFYKCILQQPKHCKSDKSENVPFHPGIYTWRSSSDQSIELWKDLSFRLVVKRFQRLRHVQVPFIIDTELDYWHIIWKVVTTNRGLNLKKLFSHFTSHVRHFMESHFEGLAWLLWKPCAKLSNKERKFFLW